jgi:hypothetical protein
MQKLYLRADGSLMPVSDDVPAGWKPPAVKPSAGKK